MRLKYRNKLKIYSDLTVYVSDTGVVTRSLEDVIGHSRSYFHIINSEASDVNPLYKEFKSIKVRDAIGLNQYAMDRIIYLNTRKTKIETEFFCIEYDGWMDDFWFDYDLLYGKYDLEYGDKIRLKRRKKNYTIISPPKLVGDDRIASSFKEYLDFDYKLYSNIYACPVIWSEELEDYQPIRRGMIADEISR